MCISTQLCYLFYLLILYLLTNNFIFFCIPLCDKPQDPQELIPMIVLSLLKFQLCSRKTSLMRSVKQEWKWTGLWPIPGLSWSKLNQVVMPPQLLLLPCSGWHLNNQLQCMSASKFPSLGLISSTIFDPMGSMCTEWPEMLHLRLQGWAGSLLIVPFRWCCWLIIITQSRWCGWPSIQECMGWVESRVLSSYFVFIMSAPLAITLSLDTCKYKWTKRKNAQSIIVLFLPTIAHPPG